MLRCRRHLWEAIAALLAATGEFSSDRELEEQSCHRFTNQQFLDDTRSLYSFSHDFTPLTPNPASPGAGSSAPREVVPNPASPSLVHKRPAQSFLRVVGRAAPHPGIQIGRMKTRLRRIPFPL